MNDNTTVKAVDSIGAAGEALKMAEDLANSIAADHKKVASMSPALVDQLVGAGLLDDSERTVAFSKLADHAGALQVLGNVIKFAQKQKTAYEQRLAAAGPGVADTSKSTKTASTSGSGRGAIDSVQGLGSRSKADEVFLSRLGLR